MKQLNVLFIALGMMISFMFMGSASAFSLGDWNSLPGDRVELKVKEGNGCVSYGSDRRCVGVNETRQVKHQQRRQQVKPNANTEAGVYKASDLKKQNYWEVKTDNDPSWVNNLETLDEYLDRQPAL